MCAVRSLIRLACLFFLSTALIHLNKYTVLSTLGNGDLIGRSLYHGSQDLQVLAAAGTSSVSISTSTTSSSSISISSASEASTTLNSATETPTSIDPNSTLSSESQSGLSKGAIGGIAAVVTLAALLILRLIVYFVRRRRARGTEESRLATQTGPQYYTPLSLSTGIPSELYGQSMHESLAVSQQHRSELPDMSAHRGSAGSSEYHGATIGQGDSSRQELP
jgi:hypothetical protein